MIEIKNLYLSYTKEYYTLNDINLSVNRGEHVIIFGEKESGKSSLIRVLAGLEKPTKGQVLLQGKEIEKVNFKTDVQMGYLSSAGAFFNHKSVKKNLAYVLQIRKKDKQELTNAVNAVILKNKLEPLANLKINQLSLFDKLKVALARLSLRPLQYIVIDDVFESLSADESKVIAEGIMDLLEQNPNATFVVAVNNLSVAEKFKGRVVTLKYGSIIQTK